MEIFNLPTPQAYGTLMDSYRLVPNNHNEEVSTSPEDLGHFVYRDIDERNGQPSLLQSPKSISNPFNFFYFELDILNQGTWVMLGLAGAAARVHMSSGRANLNGFVMGLVAQANSVSLMYQRNKVWSRSLSSIGSIGLGVHILKMVAFVTVDGKLEFEAHIQRLPPCFPSVIIMPGSDVRARFATPKFDILKYSKDAVASMRGPGANNHSNSDDEETSRSPEKKPGKINKRKTADVVAEYLKMRGFGKTLDRFKQSDVYQRSKSKKTRDDKTRGEVLKTKTLTRIREEINGGNWEYFLKEPKIGPKLSNYLRANVTIRALIQRYQGEATEEGRVALLANYSEQYGDLKDEEVLGTNKTVEGVLCSLMCEEGSFAELISDQAKQEVLETFYEHCEPRQCELVNTMRFADALLRTHAEANEFEAGHGMGNFQF